MPPDRPWARTALTILLLLPISLPSAQESAPPEDDPARESEPASLEQIVVTGTRSEQTLSDIPVATTVLTEAEIQEGRVALNLEESLRRVPGVRIEDELGGSTGGRNRIIIRGVGTRANNPAGSGVRGVRVLVDGVPKNNAGGSAQDLTNIDLGSAERIEVIRGPSSALYGNQSGGVVNIITQSGRSAPGVEYKQVIGSYGLARENLKIGGETGDLGYLFSIYRSDSDGYRRQSESSSTGFNSKLEYSIDDQSDLTVVAGFDHSSEESPGPLTREQFNEDPRQASPLFAQNDVHSTVEEFRFGATYHREFENDGDLETTFYYVPRSLGPFQQLGIRIPQDFTNRGVSTRYLHAQPLFGMESRLTIGADFQNTPITTGVFSSVTGDAFAELEEEATTYGIYLLEELNLNPEFILSLGARFDHIRFTSEDLARASDKVSRTFEEVTPKLGLTYNPDSNLMVYLNLSRGFETPIIGELRRLPGGAFGFNQDVEPQKTTNYEIGTRGELGNDRLTWEVALYRQEIEDFISPFGPTGMQSFQNIAEVDQNGFELALDYRILPFLSFYAAYTYSDFTFDEFFDGQNDLSGNRLPGVPEHMLFADLTYRDTRGWYVTLEMQYSDEFFVNDVNTATNESYTVFNLRTGYDALRIGRVEIAPFLAVNNLFDETYSAFTFINDADERFFNPQPETNFYGGFSARF